MLIGVSAFLVLVIALLAVPLTLTFRISWQQEFQSHITLLWLFGLVRIQLPSPELKSSPPEGVKRAQKNGRSERVPRRKRNVFAAVRQPAFRRRLTRFLGDAWHAIHKRDVCLRLRIGLGDPADTGRLWAIAGPLAGMLCNAREASVEIVPEFLDEIIELDSSGNIRLVPLQIFYLTIGLLLSPSVWQGIKQMRIAG